MKLLDRVGFSDTATNTNLTPYRAGYPVDKTNENIVLPAHIKEKIEDARPHIHTFQQLSMFLSI